MRYYALNDKAARALSPILEPGDVIYVEPDSARIVIDILAERGIPEQGQAITALYRWKAAHPNATEDEVLQMHELLVSKSVAVLGL